MMEDKIGGLYYVKVIFTHKSLLDLYCLYNIMSGSLMCEYPFLSHPISSTVTLVL